MKVFNLLFCVFCMIYTYCTFSKYKSDFFDKVEEATPSRYSEDEDIRTVAIMPTKRKKLVNDSVVLIPNSEFEYLPNQFTIDDTELLRGQDLVCLPESFGYSIEQGEKVFPPFTYPKCSENSNQNDTYLHIDRDSNTLYMDCPDDDNNQFITGPVDKRRIVRSNEVFYKWKVEDYDSPTDASEIEFAIGTCKDDEYFTQATMAPRFNKSLFDSIPSKSSEKPRIIYFLTLDSMSRRHFFRKLPRVVKVLNDLNKDSNFSVFDFKLHNILGPDSISNQVPIMGGKDRFRRDFRGDQNIDFLGDKAMWNLMRKKGFISLLGLENCDNYFPGSLGRMPTVDYSVGPFYCAVQKYSGVMFDKKFKKVQRCLGGHQTHYYLLNYTRSLVKMYPGANFWLYNHLNAAHEATGQHASTLNDDISEYLEDFLNTFGEQYDIWIYLHADHGMRYGNWFQDTDAYQENKLPSLFVISSKSLLEKYKYSYFTLKTNSERLTSKLDLRETTLFLAGINETSKFSVNLLEEVANKSRTCNECSIDAWDCACNAMEVVEKPCNDIEMILENLKNYAEKIINSASYADPQYPLGRYCRKIVLEKITKIYHVSISNIHEFFKLEIESSTQKGMKFQINYILASDNKARRHLGFSCESTIYNSRVWMKALSISRIDTFAGPCEIKSRNLGLKPEFCACVD